MPILSVIICTHRRYPLLEKAIDSLILQKVSRETFEVIVVDNDTQPTPEIERLVQTAFDHLDIHYVYESIPGASRARNAGTAASKAEYIAYLDDDAQAGPDWIRLLVEYIEEYSLDICGGPILPMYTGERPDWFSDKYGSASNYGELPRRLTRGEYLSGIFVCRKSIFYEINGFNKNIGPGGKKFEYGEDTLFIEMAWQKRPNLLVWYVPGAWVKHLVRPEKYSVRWLLTSSIQRGYGYARVLLLAGRTRSEGFKEFLRFGMRICLILPAIARALYNPFKLPWQQALCDELMPALSKTSYAWRLAINDFLK